MRKEFKRILVANRGEIAIRILRSAAEMGYVTTAIYSPHDRTSLAVRFADEAVGLKGNLPKESYLDQDQVVHAIKSARADAVHPGYGFLSENADFAARLQSEGITFVGPSPEAITMLGDKTQARILAGKLGIPTPSGTTEAINSAQEAADVADRVGYPVLLKAAAGGGGKGMRKVHKADELENALERATGEARSAFGDGRVYVEKYIEEPRHIEIQILADTHGNVVHLGERECSIQRRHQKLVEESPSAAVNDALRKEMGEAAVSLIREAKYTGAGTVEFLLDKNGKYYFLEVNTRLQVEHPVTEMVTGLDLVREQFHIAEGRKLSVVQSDIKQRGHAIEIRIQAEDTWNDFLPSLGTIEHLTLPSGPYVRLDSGLFLGLVVSGYYDSLLAKLIVWDQERTGAIRRMNRALKECRIVGVSTTVPFGIFVMENEEFGAGDFSTAFIDRHFDEGTKEALKASYMSELEAPLAVLRKSLDERAMRKRFVLP